MPDKHFYFAMGASIAACAVVALGSRRHTLHETSALIRLIQRKNKDWFLYFPFMIGLSGCYGLIPDIVHAMGWLPKAATRGAAFDIFLLHSSFERWEDMYQELDRALDIAGALALLFIALGSLVFYAREIIRVGQSNQK